MILGSILKLIIFCMLLCYITLEWLDQRLFILIIVLGCFRKCSVVCIQTGHTFLLSLQDKRWLWRGCWLGVHTIHQSLFISDIKGSNGTVHWNLLDRSSLTMKCFLGCVRKLSVGHIQTGHTGLLPPHVCGRLWQGCWLGVHNFLNQLIAFPDLKYPSSY